MYKQGQASINRAKLGYSRGGASYSVDRAKLGFSRGTSKETLGVVGSKYANGKRQPGLMSGNGAGQSSTTLQLHSDSPSTTSLPGKAIDLDSTSAQKSSGSGVLGGSQRSRLSQLFGAPTTQSSCSGGTCGVPSKPKSNVGRSQPTGKGAPKGKFSSQIISSRVISKEPKQDTLSSSPTSGSGLPAYLQRKPPVPVLAKEPDTEDSMVPETLIVPSSGNIDTGSKGRTISYGDLSKSFGNDSGAVVEEVIMKPPVVEERIEKTETKQPSQQDLLGPLMNMMQEKFDEISMRIGALEEKKDEKVDVDKKEDDEKIYYGQVATTALFFSEVPASSVSEDEYKDLADGEAEKDEWVPLNQNKVVIDGKTWFRMPYVSPETGDVTPLFTPQIYKGNPNFSRFSMFPVF